VTVRSLYEPHPSRLSHDHPQRESILARHADAVDQGAAGYSDPVSGYFVLTAAYLAARGTCCEQGCRHCPYIG
jgi:hypothetical protein